ncbi:MAG: transposase [Oscillospiraceae bacterium]|nr:transposase [Oscillospiraceae bacterium]
MYRRSQFAQQKIEMPFGVELDPENRWVKLAKLMPWEKIEELYARNFSAKGQEALPARLAFAALYIQSRLSLTDEETVNQIRENPSMQYFCGNEIYTPAKPFDSSLLVHFRKRLTSEMIKEITAEAAAKLPL